MIDQVVFSSIHIFPYPRLRRIVSSSISLAAAVCSCRAALFCVTVSSIEFSVTQKSPKATFLSPWGISYFIVYSSLSSEESSSSPCSSPWLRPAARATPANRAIRTPCYKRMCRVYTKTKTACSSTTTTSTNTPTTPAGTVSGYRIPPKAVTWRACWKRLPWSTDTSR